MRGINNHTLIGPVLYVRSPCGWWVPDYSRPGVRERIAEEVDMTLAEDGRKS